MDKEELSDRGSAPLREVFFDQIPKIIFSFCQTNRIYTQL
jgi:hypothetical protein